MNLTLTRFGAWRASLVRMVCVACALVLTDTALAALQDEIQVYTDEINQPGEYGLEWHINSTPSGISTPGYSGEITSHHGLRSEEHTSELQSH